MFTKMMKVSGSIIATAAILYAHATGFTPASAATYSAAVQPLPACSTVTSTVPGHHLDGSVDPTISFIVQGEVCTQTQTSLGAPPPTSTLHQSSGRPERSMSHILKSFARSTHPRCNLSTGSRAQPAGSTAPASLPCNESQGAYANGDSGNSYCLVSSNPNSWAACAHGYMRFHYRYIQTGTDGYVDAPTHCQSGFSSPSPSGDCLAHASVTAGSGGTIAYTSVLWNWYDNATEYLSPDYGCQ